MKEIGTPHLLPQMMNWGLIPLQLDRIHGGVWVNRIVNRISLHLFLSSPIYVPTVWWKEVHYTLRFESWLFLFTWFSKILLAPWFPHCGIYGVITTTVFNVEIESDGGWISSTSAPSTEWVLIKRLNQTSPRLAI